MNDATNFANALKQAYDVQVYFASAPMQELDRELDVLFAQLRSSEGE